MKTAIAALTTLLVSAGAALAQDHALTPTDVLGFGKVAATVSFQLAEGKAEFKDPSLNLDLDADISSYELSLAAAVGLGMGFEVEASVPYQIQGTTEGNGDLGASTVETEQNSDGFGDAVVTLNYELLEEKGSTPQWIFALIIGVPTGNDKRGEAELTLNNTVIQKDEDGGNGDGVWRYGFGSAISTKAGLVEPYLGASYVFGGEKERNDVDEEYADVGSILVGAEFHVTPNATIDLRVIAQFVTDQITEDTRVEKEEEAHKVFTGQGQLYVGLGTGATLVLTGGVSTSEDHDVDTRTGAEIEGTFIYFLGIGLHLKLGF